MQHNTTQCSSIAMITSRTRRLAVPIADLFVAQLREISLFDAVSDPVRLQAFTDRPPNVHVNVHVNENVNLVDNSTSNKNNVSQNLILQISTPLSSRFQKASTMIKRKLNENDDNQNNSINNNNNYVNKIFGNVNNKTNLVHDKSLYVNHIIDTQHDNSTSSTSTSGNTSMLKLVEISKQNIMKSKFIVPVRKESSSLNIEEHSAKNSNIISVANNKQRKKNEKEKEKLSHNLNPSTVVSHELIKKTKVNNDKSDDVVIHSKDDQRKITKKSSKTIQKKDVESNTNLNKRIVEELKVAKVDKKGKRKLKAIEEIKCTSDNDNDDNNDPGNGGDDYDDNNDNANDNNNENKNEKMNIKTSKIMKTNINSDKNKSNHINENNAKRNEVMSAGKTNKSNGTNIVHAAHPSDTVRKSKKVAAEKKKEVSTTIEAVKNIPRNKVPTSPHRSAEGSLEEEILSDDDSLCLGSDQENDEMEDKESVVKVKGKGDERGGNDGKKASVRHHTVSDDHHYTDHNENSNKDVADEEDDDDMLFAE